MRYHCRESARVGQRRMKTFGDEGSLEQTMRNRVVEIRKTPINHSLMLMSCNSRYLGD